ncbi:hypothetical protein SCE1572_38860 [Sorangium cellulosum So0157-2]|uniref:Uncharacterized protein n=1 Tax=Sorangium cellulosum So0157-2 TaxID=1254432 RepID=S4Y6W5_SORCE|nr:hypothetical protein SCE1572_38860 [Sorangium cellulosum So0157-2]
MTRRAGPPRCIDDLASSPRRAGPSPREKGSAPGEARRPDDGTAREITLEATREPRRKRHALVDGLAASMPGETMS